MRRLFKAFSVFVRRAGFRLVFDSDTDYRKSILISGTGRSGTTWLSEIVNYRNEYRDIFEPFNSKKLSYLAAFGDRPYLRPHEVRPDLRQLAHQVLSGGIRSAWTERFNRRFVAHQRLIKDIRTNLMLKWLHCNFPGMPIVLMMRHPCAVAYSYEKEGWRGAVGPLLAQENLMQDFLGPYKAEVENARDAFERAIFIWCIETLVPLTQFRSDEVHLVFYENLLLDPKNELDRLFTYLGKENYADALAVMDRPSRTSRRGSAVRTGEDRLSGWRKKVSAGRVQRAMEIVRLFGLETIYSEESTPNISAAIEMMDRERAPESTFV